MKRIILLGASNVTINFPLIVQTLRAALGPVELLTAHGHGRSYGMTSRVLVRTLPGIRQCGLWDALKNSRPSENRPLALITDVGNDVIYGAPVERILSWVEECIRRLCEANAAIVVTSLPLDSIRSLGRLRFGVTRTLFFPTHGPSWHEVRQIAPELDAGLQRLGERYRASTVSPLPEWYGFDPIHIRRRHRPTAWQRYFSAWPGFPDSKEQLQVSFRDALRVRRARPASRTLFGRAQEAAQPAIEFADGSSVGVF